MTTTHTWTAILLAYDICPLQAIRGASEQEILTLEHMAKHPFPTAYRQFLQELGHGAGTFLRGTDIFLPTIKELRQAAITLLQSNKEAFELPDDAYVFCMHQGYEFCYFRSHDGANPPIYQYVESQGAPVVAWPSFNAFLIEAVRAHAGIFG